MKRWFNSERKSLIRGSSGIRARTGGPHCAGNVDLQACQVSDLCRAAISVRSDKFVGSKDSAQAGHQSPNSVSFAIERLRAYS
jgi:hypothetical protein